MGTVFPEEQDPLDDVEHAPTSAPAGDGVTDPTPPVAVALRPAAASLVTLAFDVFAVEAGAASLRAPRPLMAVLVDEASRFVLAILVTPGEPDAPDVARLVRQGIGRPTPGRRPVHLSLDNAWRRSFRSELAALLPDVVITYRAPFAPNPRGAVERVFRELRRHQATPPQAPGTRADDSDGGPGASPLAP